MKRIGYISKRDREIIIVSGNKQEIFHYAYLGLVPTGKTARGRDQTDEDPDYDNMSSYLITVRDLSGHVTVMSDVYLYSNHATSKRAWAWNALNE